MDNTTNIFNSISVNYTIIGYTFISLLRVNLEPTNENNIYYIYYPSSLSLYIDNRTEEDFATYHTIKSLSISKKYYINIIEISLNNKALNFDVIYEPKITNDIILILILLFNKGNTSEYIELKISLNSNSNKYSSSLEYLDFSENCFLTIYSTKIEHNDWYNKYYTYYPYSYLYFSDQTEKVSTNNVVVDSTSYSDNRGKEENEETENTISISYSKKYSSNSSIGMIIGIIAGILVLIVAITGIVIYIRRKKKKNIDNKNNMTLENFKSENSLIKKNSEGDLIVKEPKENIRTFIFQTQNQEKEILSIESDKSMKELRKLYLEKINNGNLIDYKNIFFLFNGKHFTIETEGLIRDYFDDYVNPNIIIVVDNDEKIHIKKN